MTHKRRAKADPCTTGRLLTFFIEDSARASLCAWNPRSTTCSRSATRRRCPRAQFWDKVSADGVPVQSQPGSHDRICTGRPGC